MPRQIDRSKVVVFFGLTGSGKSYLGKRWAAERGYPYFNSDQVRKELAGVAPESRHHVPFNEGLYSPDMTRQTYDEMALRALAALRDNEAGVVLDGSYGAEKQRLQVVDALSSRGAIFFVHCHCQESVARARFQLRAADSGAVSDGRWEIYVGQKKSFEMPKQLKGASLLDLDTDDSIAALITRVDNFIESTYT